MGVPSAEACLYLRVRSDIIRNARIKYVGKYQSCMVSNGRFIPHASYASCQTQATTSTSEPASPAAVILAGAVCVRGGRESRAEGEPLVVARPLPFSPIAPSLLKSHGYMTTITAYSDPELRLATGAFEDTPYIRNHA